jgi:hypothetical protein
MNYHALYLHYSRMKKEKKALNYLTNWENLQRPGGR